METVNFTHMIDGTAEEYRFLAEKEVEFTRELPDRIMRALGNLEHSFSGYRVSRLEHSLQSGDAGLLR